MMSNQQNAYLKAMGIDVWVERSPTLPAENSSLTEQVSESEPVLKSELEPGSEVVLNSEASQLIPESVTATSATLNVKSLDWHELRSTIAECQLCELAKNRTKTIFGTGKKNAALMIIGGAPNAEDELHGEPFTGEAGKLLTAMINAMGYQRKDVYISNLVKCRTSESQDPSIDEVAACASYLRRQVQLLQPGLILALGSVTAQRLLKSKSTMSRLRGQLHYIDEITVPIVVSFEPAYLLRSPNEKRKAWEDLQLAMKELSTIETSTEIFRSVEE
ncbi:MAG: uracil-DNA glycosylase [Gammaproteobacteria bacterium]|nr:uracil-DNA glycosylase [Gammaproteobacteria bacterium]MCW8988594.1 uracil-DNA glycosylase [Gammaproteobacteria bacterium]